jgi:hypothetical protein
MNSRGNHEYYGDPNPPCKTPLWSKPWPPHKEYIYIYIYHTRYPTGALEGVGGQPQRGLEYI